MEFEIWSIRFGGAGGSTFKGLNVKGRFHGRLTAFMKIVLQSSHAIIQRSEVFTQFKNPEP